MSAPMDRDGYDTAVLRAAQAVAEGGELMHVPTVVAELLDAYARLVARVAEMEAGGTRTEWAVGDPDDCATNDDVREVNGPNGLSITDRDYGRSLLKRTAHLGAWTAAS